MERKSNMYSNSYITEINLKEIFTDDEFKIIMKYLTDEEIKDKLSQKKIVNEKKNTPSFKKAMSSYERTDFIFKLLRICIQRLKSDKEFALSKGLEW
jgi:hypothetical protein